MHASILSSQNEEVDNSEKAKKYYSEAYEVISQLLLNCDVSFNT